MGLRRVGAVGLGHRARQEFERGMHRHVALSDESLQGALLQGTVTGHPSQAIDTGYCHWIPSLEALPRISATDKCHRSLSRINITAAYKQRHPG